MQRLVASSTLEIVWHSPKKPHQPALDDGGGTAPLVIADRRALSESRNNFIGIEERENKQTGLE
jgi:hypothetical protein